MRVVIALGGNALLERGEPPHPAIQRERLAAIAPALARIALAHELVIVHGNGPQVGALASSLGSGALDSAAELALDELGALSQGMIGFWISEALTRALAQLSSAPPMVLTVLSRTLVSPTDAAWDSPSKFIGPVLSASQAEQLSRSRGWVIGQDGSHLRRVVASPAPIALAEAGALPALLATRAVLIAGGGGGVPVWDPALPHPGRAPAAVVDKDALAAVLAAQIHADALVIAMDGPGLQLGFGSERPELVVSAAPDHLHELELPAGSMGPKLDAALAFVAARPVSRSVIGPLSELEELVSGTSGTQISLAAARVTRPL